MQFLLKYDLELLTKYNCAMKVVSACDMSLYEFVVACLTMRV